MKQTEIATLVERVTRAEADRAELLAACRQVQADLDDEIPFDAPRTRSMVKKAIKNAEKGRAK